MTINKKLLLTLALIAALQGAQTYPWFDDFDEVEDFFDQQWQRMADMRKEMRKSMRSFSANLATAPVFTSNIADNEKNVVITMRGIEAQELDARVNDGNNKLTITTPTDDIRILVNGNLVTIDAKHEIKTIKKDAQDKEQEFYSAHASSMSQVVKGALILEKQTIEYDHENKELTITIPKRDERGKTVPVTHVSKKKKDLEKKDSEKTDTKKADKQEK